MKRDHVLDMLRQYEPELRAAGVVSLSLLGSAARNEANPTDVGIAVQLAESFSRGGFHYFGRLEELEQRLSQILGCKLDVIEEPVRGCHLQQHIEQDRAFAF